ncbi:MAG: M20/M25/M40 family metallo-hydrolase [Lachnospiraceae bacterium]
MHNACQNDPWLRENPPEVTWIFNWPPFDTNRQESICNALQCAAELVHPGAGRFNGFVAVCDATFLQEKGIPVIVMGPGDTEFIHSIDEKLSISQLVDAAKIYALVMADWCGVAES